MTIHLDHAIVLSRDKAAAAKQLAELLGVPLGAGCRQTIYLGPCQ